MLLALSQCYQIALTVLLLCGSSAQAIWRDYRIDDTEGDEITGVKPEYNGPVPWRERSPQSDCPICTINPEAGNMYLRTWHDASTGPGQTATITFTFTGIAVHIFCALSRTETHLTLIVDGVAYDQFDWFPNTTATPEFQYKKLVLSASYFDSKAHTVTVRSDAAENVGNILFDYATYTVDDGSPSSAGISQTILQSSAPTYAVNSTSSNLALPLGLGIGLGIFLGLVTATILMLWVRRKYGNMASMDVSNDQHSSRPHGSQVPSYFLPSAISHHVGPNNMGSIEAASVDPLREEITVPNSSQSATSHLPQQTNDQRAVGATRKRHALEKQVYALSTPPQYSPSQ